MPRSHQKFCSVLAVKLLGNHVKKQMLAQHFSHYYNRRCQRMVSELTGVISPSWDIGCDFDFLEGLLCSQPSIEHNLDWLSNSSIM